MLATTLRTAGRVGSAAASRSALATSRAFAAIPTALEDWHVARGGKMVEFAGYSLPVLYEGPDSGVVKEHLATRADGSCTLFDVSHMGQLKWTGADRVKFIESVVVGDIAMLGDGEGKLSLITNASGGIIDDTVICNAGDHVYMVVNGACKHGDMAHFKEQLAAFDGDVAMEYMDDLSLLALQGPAAPTVMGELAPSLDMVTMNFMTGTVADVAGIPCRVTRCGYTGEDGFEISCKKSDTVALADALTGHAACTPAGLGARDSLRLEAGLCLYGNDLDGTTNPVEGVLTWTIGGPKTRRRKEQGFVGAEHFLTEEGKLKKQTRKRVGIAGMKAPARQGATLYAADGETEIGVVTSGTMSPTLKKPIAMGYVTPEHAKAGTEIVVGVRNKKYPAEVAKMPFVEQRYYKAP